MHRLNPYRPCALMLRPPSLADYLLALPWRRVSCLFVILAVAGPIAVSHAHHAACHAGRLDSCRVIR